MRLECLSESRSVSVSDDFADICGGNGCMDYRKDILNRLLDIYEKRGAFDRDASSLRAVQIDVKKEYPAYADRYNYDTYEKINAATDCLCAEGLVLAKKDTIGRYSKVKLNVSAVLECYKKLNRTSIPEQCEAVKRVLAGYETDEYPLLRHVIRDWNELLEGYKKLPYDLKYNGRRVDEVLCTLRAVLKLGTESYIRNFSTALFKDSKRFQKEFRGTVEAILYDYTEEVVERDKILSFYNLYENPTYVLIKGEAVIYFGASVIDLAEIPDGIALPNASLAGIKTIKIKKGTVITVENLTTYHDSDEEDAVHIYLGGYHNREKQILLEKIFADNRNCHYFHKGDLDVYGFLILENLKEKTGIPFLPLMMDVNTLKRFYHVGIYKELSGTDRGIIE